MAAKRKPTDSQWQSYDTRTVGALTGFNLTAENPPLDQYGGLIGTPAEATGFFHTEKIGERWWLIDPLGHRFLHIGVCSVAAGKSSMDREATQKRFSNDEQWARTTNDLLREHGFNGTGAGPQPSYCEPASTRRSIRRRGLSWGPSAEPRS